MTVRPMFRGLRAGAVAATGLAGVLLVTAVHSQVPPAFPVGSAAVNPAAGPAPVNPALANSPGLTEAQRMSEGFTEVAAAVLPSVVTIRMEATAPAQNADPGGFPFPFPFHGTIPGGQGWGGGGGTEVVRGTGSGVIIRADGVILTNNHVVEDARTLSVHLRDGRVLPARVLGTDPSTDLAIIQVNGQNLPVARWADSDAARVGEWVLAIGAPFGLEATVTHGVLSAKGRAGLGANPIEDYLQTDASINPGNSGGALVNLRGEVLGIPTMIIGRGNNIGFAVPSRIARAVADQILATGHVTRGWIGVGVQDLSSDLAQSLGLQPDTGAIVSQVDPGGPGARAGLAPGDVITAINQHPVLHSHDVVREVTDRAPGDPLEILVHRHGAIQRITVQAGRRPEDPRAARQTVGSRMPDPHNQDGAVLGIEVAPLAPQRSRALGTQGGVVVTRVEPGGAADRAGLQPGDLILRADDAAVHTPGDLQTATRDGHAALLVRRGDRQLFVPLRM